MKKLKEYKFKAKNPNESKEAFTLFSKLGYKPDFEYKFPLAPYIYANENGRLGYDWFDAEGTDKSDPHSAEGYFISNSATLVDIQQLRSIAGAEA
ncbi:hypothetical protein [Acinetobacter guerrae]|uniref:hypothetical protein n=1 Tax=Acinetobacter guerrae TaxID=1843371 RepID=UPI00128DB179|nr:hypothetical protein [Acinetobacter guerrae]